MSKRSHLQAPSRSDADTNTGRQRQSKRDEAIRQKFERELSKKRTTPIQRQQQYRKIAGTVSALRPAQALTVKESMLVIEASQLMAAKRSDCVLVVDDDDHLSGIFTAKDIAYRVVAVDDMDARSTPVADIMTPNPMCVTASTSAQDALNLMVSRGFRHLPVCNEEGDIFGLLDITKCLYEALDKMERAYGSSRKLYDALEGVEREWSGNPVQLVQYMEVLRDRMSCPDMTTVMDHGAVEVNYKVNVREIAKMMKECHTTAVLVMKHHRLAGIFTTKDIVLRVIAAGLNPENCSVVRVMTPEPDCAEPSTTVLEALKRMNDGHYLNLPILEDGRVVGIVDVLKLTYATLEQMNSIQGNDGEGPMWSRFWDSFGGVESESQGSSDPNGSHYLSSGNRHSASHVDQVISPEPSASFSQLQGFSEIQPNESASMVMNNDEASSISSYRKSSSITRNTHANGTTFKFTSLGGKTHRFMMKSNSYAYLLDSVRQKVLGEHVQFVAANHSASSSTADSNSSNNNIESHHQQEDGGEWLSISYMDDENDLVLISSDADVEDAVMMAQKLDQNRVKLFVHDTAAPQPVTNSTMSPTMMHLPSMKLEVPGVDQNNNNKEQLEMLTDSEDEQMELKTKNKRRSFKEPTVPHHDILLPAAITFLGVVIIGVFAYSRISQS
ncbi:uncharacterized protein BX664DRAFT_385529 [Halteromyces radiatus]|uniref:uncharacterized protein n=1 Tax=Halteromyces radiatus TaxID=101107 RepID=UPI00221FFF9B|nr:uncharacterized protein BX664DRAFT_385529 [Halteromyces radiatus]KAI8088954.1 hypothetical protein BX664DRAFT_385529 [Halteromyces radiatus]